MSSPFGSEDRFNPEDFRDAIDDMCDDALRRMYAFQEGGLNGMHPRDHYFSQITSRHRALHVVEYDTQTRASIIDDIHRDIIEDSSPPDHMLYTLSGAMIALARHAAFRGKGSNVVVPTDTTAQSHVGEKLLTESHSARERKPIDIVSYELGSLGMTRLVIAPHDDTWELYYDAHYRVARFLP